MHFPWINITYVQVQIPLVRASIGFSQSPSSFFFNFFIIISWHVFFLLNGGRFEKNFCPQMKLFPVKS